MSRQEFKTLIQSLQSDNSSLKDINAYFISIHSDSPVIDDKTGEFFKTIGVKGHISLDFDDLTPKDVEQGGEELVDSSYQWGRPCGKFVLFNNEHAKQIVDMFEEIKKTLSDKETVIIVHCYAGISRSGAVSTVASRYFNDHVNHHEFNKENPQIQPNYHVVKLLTDEIMEREKKV